MSSLKRLFDHYETPTGRVTETFHYDAETGVAGIEITHDVDAGKLVEMAEQAPDQGEGMRLARVVPSHVLDRAFVEGWFHDKKRWKQWANSSEGLAFAVPNNGRITRL